MKKSKRKIREKRDIEKTFKVMYLFEPENTKWYTFYHARNKQEAENYFNEDYDRCTILDTVENE